MSKLLKLGTYFLETGNVDIFVDPDRHGGDFRVCRDDESPPAITVGFGRDETGLSDWICCVNYLIHETLELILHNRRCRLSTSGDMGMDHAEYTFICNHPVFSHACAALAGLLVEVLPDMGRMYNDLETEHKRAKKKIK